MVFYNHNLALSGYTLLKLFKTRVYTSHRNMMLFETQVICKKKIRGRKISRNTLGVYTYLCMFVLELHNKSSCILTFLVSFYFMPNMTFVQSVNKLSYTDITNISLNLSINPQRKLIGSKTNHG